MPCRDYPSDEYASPPNLLQPITDQLKKDLDERTAQLCTVFNTFEIEYPVPLSLFFNENRDIEAWWEQHKQDDKSAMFESIISKLTEKEQEFYIEYIRGL